MSLCPKRKDWRRRLSLHSLQNISGIYSKRVGVLAQGCGTRSSPGDDGQSATVGNRILSKILFRACGKLNLSTSENLPVIDTTDREKLYRTFESKTPILPACIAVHLFVGNDSDRQAPSHWSLAVSSCSEKPRPLLLQRCNSRLDRVHELSIQPRWAHWDRGDSKSRRSGHASSRGAGYMMTRSISIRDTRRVPNKWKWTYPTRGFMRAVTILLQPRPPGACPGE